MTDLDGLAAALSSPTPGLVRPPGGWPDRTALGEAIAHLRRALFADHLGAPAEGRMAFVRGELAAAHARFVREVARDPGVQGGDAAIDALFAELPVMRAVLVDDLHAAVDGDPAATGAAEILLCYPGFDAILHHRIAHTLYRAGARLAARMLSEVAHSRTGIDIHPGASIGGRFFIDHGTGVVIGETAMIGRNVKLYQGVTLGARSFPVDAHGHIIRGAARHPILEDDVQVFAGASILGRVTIGRGAIIGGGVWLTKSVPPHGRVLQAPARADSFADGAGI
jgi:serine O-acetyltransferase